MINKFNKEMGQKKSKLNVEEKKFSNKKCSPHENIKLNKTIKAHNDWIKSVKIFPSGNLVSVSDDRSIIIYDGL